MNQRIRLRPASVASQASLARPQIIPGLFPYDSQIIKLSESSRALLSDPWRDQEVSNITKTIVITVSLGLMNGIRTILKPQNTYNYVCFRFLYNTFDVSICFNITIWCSGIIAGDRWQNQENTTPDGFRSMKCKRKCSPG